MDRSIPQFSQILHQPARLAIAVHLHQHGDASLAAIRDRIANDDDAPDLRLSPQLSRAHCALLCRAGLIDVCDEIGSGKPIYRLTEYGRRALAAHRAAIIRFIPAELGNAIEVGAQ